jgi:hypothetical protein
MWVEGSVRRGIKWKIKIFETKTIKSFYIIKAHTKINDPLP